MVWTGRFDSRHSPRLNFSLVSLRDGRENTFDGIIDTGFTGFIQIPIVPAVTLGIVRDPITVGTVSLANGTTQQVWLKQIPVTVEGETVSGLCHIPQTQNCPVLIGIDFLRRFERILVVSSKQGILLIKENQIKLN